MEARARIMEAAGEWPMFQGGNPTIEQEMCPRDVCQDSAQRITQPRTIMFVRSWRRDGPRIGV